MLEFGLTPKLMKTHSDSFELIAMSLRSRNVILLFKIIPYVKIIRITIELILFYFKIKVNIFPPIKQTKSFNLVFFSIFF